MNKNDMQIMVVDAAKLNAFEGFTEEQGYEEIVLGNYFFMKRGDAEINPKFKQPIPYVLIINKELRMVYVYRRSSKQEDSHETRLHGKWSFGVGGHVEKIDSSLNPIRETSRREISEETTTEGIYQLLPLGYINDNSNEVGQVHFGIIYAAFTHDREIKPKDKESVEGRMMSLSEVKTICTEGNVENWSLISLGPLEKLLR